MSVMLHPPPPSATVIATAISGSGPLSRDNTGNMNCLPPAQGTVLHSFAQCLLAAALLSSLGLKRLTVLQGKGMRHTHIPRILAMHSVSFSETASPCYIGRYKHSAGITWAAFDILTVIGSACFGFSAN